MKTSPGLKATLTVIPLVAAPGAALADDELDFEATLTGDQEVVDDQGTVVPGGTASGALGRMEADFNEGLSALQVRMRIAELANTFSAAHFHCARPGANGPIVFGIVNPGPLAFSGQEIRGTLTNADYTGEDCTEVIGRPINNLASLALAMRDGLVYANVHTDAFPAGEIRGQMLPDDDDDDELDDDDDFDDDGNGDDDDDDKGN